MKLTSLCRACNFYHLHACVKGATQLFELFQILALRYLILSIAVYNGGNLCIFRHLNVYQCRTMYVSLTALRFHITNKTRVSCINWDGKQSSNRNDRDLCNNIEAVKENILEQRRSE